MTEPAEVRERLAGGARIAVLVVAVTVQFALCLSQLIGSREEYLAGWPEFAAFGMLTVVAVAGVGFLLWSKEIPSAARWSGVATTLLASTLASAAVPPEDYLLPAHWSFGLVGWYGLFLLFDLPLAAIAAFLGGHLLLTAVELVVLGVPGHLMVVPMGITAISVVGFQFAVGAAIVIFRRIAVRASEAAALEERLRTQEAIAEHMHRDHQERYVALLGTTVPLLAGLAQGILDPSNEDTRRRCAIEAARMRRLFAESDDVPDRLVHELRAGIDVAERHGVSVQLAIRGEPRELAKEVRRELIDPASAALASAVSTARATVVRTPSRVRVSVVSDARGLPPTGAEPRHIEINTVVTGNQLWVEAAWQPAT